MNIKQVLRLIQKHQPAEPSDFNRIGVSLERGVKAGVFRDVRKIKGLPLVVKFPMGHSGKIHSTVEVRKIKKISKIRSLRKYLPTVYYHDRKSGILVMSWHREFKDDKDAFNALGKMTTRALRQWSGVTVTDIHEGNVLQGKGNEIILVDLGY